MHMLCNWQDFRAVHDSVDHYHRQIQQIQNQLLSKNACDAHRHSASFRWVSSVSRAIWWGPRALAWIALNS